MAVIWSQQAIDSNGHWGTMKVSMQDLGVVIVAINSFAKKCYSGSQKSLSWLQWARMQTMYRLSGLCLGQHAVLPNSPLVLHGHWVPTRMNVFLLHSKFYQDTQTYLYSMSFNCLDDKVFELPQFTFSLIKCPVLGTSSTEHHYSGIPLSIMFIVLFRRHYVVFPEYLVHFPENNHIPAGSNTTRITGGLQAAMTITQWSLSWTIVRAITTTKLISVTTPRWLFLRS
ncbi:hypothetical protein F5146DRAFT_994319 [Armillaria mellea]|nr:hypothetical protein F5146DRAFT_994319 [Armillaria mellea]